MVYSERIKDLREDNDKTQTEVADYLGTTAQHYGKYELGKTEMSFDRAIKLAELYNVSLDYLAGRSDIKNLPHDIPDENELRAAEYLSHISERDKLLLIRTFSILCGTKE